MVLWIIRHGRHGEYENYAVGNNIVSIDWASLPSMENIEDKEGLRELLRLSYPNKSQNALNNWFGQIRSFIHKIEIGDLVCIPLRSHSALAVGEITSDYEYMADYPDGAKHLRRVNWIDKDLSRTLLPSDISQSLSSHLTVFKVRRSRAEERIRNLISGQTEVHITSEEDDEIEDLSLTIDVEDYATNAIVQYISERFRGHKFTALVGGILEAKGYIVNTSLGGPDHGVDILAGRGPMGFSQPRMVVQVKSSDNATGTRDIRDLKGTFDDFNAELGLFVAWGGFKDSVLREERRDYFQIRLWDSEDLVKELLLNYEHLPDDFKAEIPLKRIWTLVEEE